MARKVLLFISLSLAILLFNLWWAGQNQQGNQANNGENQDQPGVQEPQGEGADAEDDEHPLVAPPLSAEQRKFPHQRATLGSLNDESEYVMLVTFNNRGGAIERIEFNNPRFKNLEARRDGRGYLGHLGARDPQPGDNRTGVEVTVVGPGTPAATAGLQVGDVITSVNTGAKEPKTIESVLDWNSLLIDDANRVGKKWTLSVAGADGANRDVEITLAAEPLSLVEPVRAPASAFNDPLSMLLTLQNVGPAEGGNAPSGEIPAAADIMQYLTNSPDGIAVLKVPPTHPLALAGMQQGDLVHSVDDQEFGQVSELQNYLARIPSGTWLHFEYGSDGRQSALVRLPAEMPDMNLHNVTWELVRPDNTDNVIEFRYTDARWNLQYTKRFTLTKKSALDETKRGEELPPSYHLAFDLEIENLGGKRELAYQLDGLNGLPTEGWWYSSKLARGWFEGVGARDVMFEFQERDPTLIGAPAIATLDELPALGGEVPLQSASSDSRYFAGSLIPLRKEGSTDPWFERALAVRVGTPRLDKYTRLANTTFRLVSTPLVLEEGEKHTASFRLFAGPKSTDLLAESDYQLSELVYYGWPIWGVFAKVLQWVLHAIYGVIPNYAIAILILTVMVRGAMFPLSRKNALGAQKMQLLQPEIRRINEKYKNNPQDKMRATQELFRKHNYHPLGGCLVLFLQLPIFIGLYRALMLDVELRQAPLIPGLTAWCDNLAAPDMLFYWGDWAMLPNFLVSETGFLGPYFNILPVITIGLFIAQQKMFMPPPTDDQQRMQQKMMKYMMIFFAFMFFKVPAGLCLYFIASSVWGIAERKLLPKPNQGQAGGGSGGAGGSGGGGAPAIEPEGPSPRERRRIAASGGNGSSSKQRSKKKS